jgi:hypothetical protein
VGSRLYLPQVFYPFNEKTVILRLLKNAQMQDARKPFTCRSGRQP